MVFNNAEGLLFQNHLFRLRALRMVPEFALAWMNCGHAMSYWDLNCSTSSGLNTINRTMLREMPIGVPTVEEQKRILKVSEENRAVEETTVGSLTKLRCLKTGLMQDLLTGRVSVTPLLAGAGSLRE